MAQGVTVFVQYDKIPPLVFPVITDEVVIFTEPQAAEGFTIVRTGAGGLIVTVTGSITFPQVLVLLI